MVGDNPVILVPLKLPDGHLALPCVRIGVQAGPPHFAIQTSENGQKCDFSGGPDRRRSGPPPISDIFSSTATSPDSGGVPLRRLSTAIYLARRAGDYVVGDTITVDGGVAHANLGVAFDG